MGGSRLREDERKAAARASGRPRAQHQGIRGGHAAHPRLRQGLPGRRQLRRSGHRLPEEHSVHPRQEARGKAKGRAGLEGER